MGKSNYVHLRTSLADHDLVYMAKSLLNQHIGEKLAEKYYLVTDRHVSESNHLNTRIEVPTPKMEVLLKDFQNNSIICSLVEVDDPEALKTAQHLHHGDINLLYGKK